MITAELASGITNTNQLDDVFNWVSRKGYLASLGGVVRPVVEMVSNLEHALLNSPKALSSGTSMLHDIAKDSKDMNEFLETVKKLAKKL